MAKLSPESLAGKDLSAILTKFGQKFLGEAAVLTNFEELEVGKASYGYKVQFGGQQFILKIDNPNVGMRTSTQSTSGDTRSDEARFNLIAKFVNDKISKGMKAPKFLETKDTNRFCIIADKDDQTLPEEFKGVVISMQPFLTIAKPASQHLSGEEAKSLGDSLGIFHRPSKLATEFPTPELSPRNTFSRESCETLKKQFGNTAEERAAIYPILAAQLEIYMTQLSSSSDTDEKNLYTAPH